MPLTSCGSVRSPLTPRTALWSPWRSIHLLRLCKNSCRRSGGIVDPDHPRRWQREYRSTSSRRSYQLRHVTHARATSERTTAPPTTSNTLGPTCATPSTHPRSRSASPSPPRAQHGITSEPARPPANVFADTPPAQQARPLLCRSGATAPRTPATTLSSFARAPCPRLHAHTRSRAITWLVRRLLCRDEVGRGGTARETTTWAQSFGAQAATQATMASRPSGKGVVASNGMSPEGFTQISGDSLGSVIAEWAGFFASMSPTWTMPR